MDEDSLSSDEAPLEGERYEILPCWAGCLSPCLLWSGAGHAGGDPAHPGGPHRGHAPVASPGEARRGATGVLLRPGGAARRADFTPEEEPLWLRVVAGRCVLYGDFQRGHCAPHTYCAERGLDPAAQAAGVPPLSSLETDRRRGACAPLGGCALREAKGVEAQARRSWGTPAAAFRLGPVQAAFCAIMRRPRRQERTGYDLTPQEAL
jgi:hypothetical protein